MSLEISIHAAQMSILRELLFMPTASFAELRKPTGLTSDHFNFHVNRLVELGLVEREVRGRYLLTVKGKEYANRLDTDGGTIERQGKVAVLVVPVRDQPDGTRMYMVQKRLKQPFYGYHGFMTGKLRWGETIIVGAARELAEETGFEADMNVKGVYHKLDYTENDVLLEDKHFYVVLASNPRGQFMASFEGGENYWYTLQQIEALVTAFPGMDIVAKAVAGPGTTFWESAFSYDITQY